MLKFEKYIAFYFFKPTFPTLTVKFGQSPSYRCFESFLNINFVVHKNGL